MSHTEKILAECIVKIGKSMGILGPCPPSLTGPELMVLTDDIVQEIKDLKEYENEVSILSGTFGSSYDSFGV